jgi:hypothetical protein
MRCLDSGAHRHDKRELPGRELERAICKSTDLYFILLGPFVFSWPNKIKIKEIRGGYSTSNQSIQGTMTRRYDHVSCQKLVRLFTASATRKELDLTQHEVRDRQKRVGGSIKETKKINEKR